MKTVKDLLEQYKEIGDIDVYDDYDERIGIAYCGTQLTEKGKEKFKEVLDFPLFVVTEYSPSCPYAVISTDDMGTDKEIEQKLELAAAMFYGMAGYCPEKEWDELFYDED